MNERTADEAAPVSFGEKLAFAQDDIALRGHAIEARVYAEDPGRGFLPTGGRVLDVFELSGPGVRVDSSLLAGTVTPARFASVSLAPAPMSFWLLRSVLPPVCAPEKRKIVSPGSSAAVCEKQEADAPV